MRNFMSFVCLAVLGMMMASVNARSPVKCASSCALDSCPSVAECGCGTYKDECDCCSFCMTCADAVCSPMRGDVCVEGYSCAHPVGTEYMQRLNGEGMCVPTHTVTDGMYSP